MHADTRPVYDDVALSKADTNHDGSVSCEELSDFIVNGLGGLGIDGLPHQDQTKNAVHLLLGDADKDGDGKLSKEEFIACFAGYVSGVVAGPSTLRARLRQSDQMSAANIESTFATFDANKDGVITRDEYLSGLKQLGVEHTVEDATCLFNTIDLDHDGHLDLHEFSTHVYAPCFVPVKKPEEQSPPENDAAGAAGSHSDGVVSNSDTSGGGGGAANPGRADDDGSGGGSDGGGGAAAAATPQVTSAAAVAAATAASIEAAANGSDEEPITIKETITDTTLLVAAGLLHAADSVSDAVAAKLQLEMVLAEMESATSEKETERLQRTATELRQEIGSISDSSEPPAKRLKSDGASDAPDVAMDGGGGGGGGGAAAAVATPSSPSKASSMIAANLYESLSHPDVNSAVPGVVDAVSCKTASRLLSAVVHGSCSARIRKYGLTNGWKNFIQMKSEQMVEVIDDDQSGR